VSREGLLFLSSFCLAGCSGGGAPSFELFGAFFPAWMFCSLIGILTGVIARVVFVATGLAVVLPYQLFVCTSVGTAGGILVWLLIFAR
jgi:YtcA family